MSGLTIEQWKAHIEKRNKTLRRLNDAKLITFVTRNPGCTAMMIAKCLDRKWGTVSSMLCKICNKGKMARRISSGMRGAKETWRYYPLVVIEKRVSSPSYWNGTQSHE